MTRILGIPIKLLLWALLAASLIGVLIWLPKPVLITYQISNDVSTSVYWPTFGESGQLLDAEASFAKIDEETAHLHVCHEYGNDTSCQQFRIVETQGWPAVIGHLYL